MSFLIVFDFDHTIIDENSDLHVRKLFPNEKLLVDAENDSSQFQCWTDRMQMIFRHLNRAKIQPEDYRLNMKQMKLTEGFHQLIDYLHSLSNTELIIISDSNLIFIETILENYRLEKNFREIFTNPSFFQSDTGCLIIEQYGQQTCSTCPSNMCKREIVQRYLQSKYNDDERPRVIFIGDGHNDVCAAKNLIKNDLICARQGFRMAKELKQYRDVEKKTIDAEFFEWKTGKDIEEFLREIWLKKS